MMFKDDKYFLFYSSSWVTMTSYKVGVAVADSVLGEFVKSDEPVIQTRGAGVSQDQCGWLCTLGWGSDTGSGSEGDQVMFEGPGHGSVVEDGAGDWWLVYAVWRAGLVNTWPPGRLMMLDRITWSGASLIMSTVNRSNVFYYRREDGANTWPYIGYPSQTSQDSPFINESASITKH